MQNKPINPETGVTLIELTVVLLILVALAGVVVPYIGGISAAAMCKATDVTMQNVKKVIMERYYLDTLGHFPSKNKDTPNYNLTYLFDKPEAGDWQLFDPATQTGWRGAYLQGGIKLNDTALLYKVANLSYKDKPNNVSSNFVNDTDYVNVKFGNTDTVILDGWGRPIVLQVNRTDPNNPIAKLVSAGAGNGVGLLDDNGSLLADIDTKITDTSRQKDDRILYLNAPTPATYVNPSCDES